MEDKREDLTGRDMLSIFHIIRQDMAEGWNFRLKGSRKPAPEALVAWWWYMKGREVVRYKASPLDRLLAYYTEQIERQGDRIRNRYENTKAE